MNRHPGGEAQTLHLLENIEWKKEMKALDLGAGEGDTIRILKSFGMDAHGVDLFPRGSDVETGDFLHLQYSSDSIDLCISQCAFFVSRDQKNALSECWLRFKKGRFSFIIRSGYRKSFGNGRTDRVYHSPTGGSDVTLAGILSGSNLE